MKTLIPSVITCVIGFLLIAFVHNDLQKEQYNKCEHVFVNTTHQDTATIYVEREFTGMDDWKVYEVMKADKPCICLFCHERGKCY